MPRSPPRALPGPGNSCMQSYVTNHGMGLNSRFLGFFEINDQASRLILLCCLFVCYKPCRITLHTETGIEENVTNDISKKAHVDFKSLQITKRLESCSRLSLLFYVFCLKLKSSSYAFEFYFWHLKTLHRPCKCKLVFVQFNICMF